MSRATHTSTEAVTDAWMLPICSTYIQGRALHHVHVWYFIIRKSGVDCFEEYSSGFL